MLHTLTRMPSYRGTRVAAVFLEHQFVELRLKEGEEKIVDIVRKTWGKMSEKVGTEGGRAAVWRERARC